MSGRATTAEPEVAAGHFDICRDLLYDRCGIVLPESRREVLALRLASLTRKHGLDDPAPYVAGMRGDANSVEWRAFVDELTVQETFFFRIPQQFDWVAARLRGGLIWSAGCSTGEEPYSLAIALAEQDLGRPWRIVATDISERAIHRANEHRYSERSMRLVDDARRDAWFTGVDERWELGSPLADRVHFAQHNLLHRAPVQNAECVFLRNVMIYFDADSRRRALANVMAAVAPGGHLVLGPTEGVFDLLKGWDRVAPFVFQRPEGAGGVTT